MRRRRQLGQSMTEYLVVLGVTGAALLAATGDVSAIFGTVKDGYQKQSSEMNKVQLYNSHKVRFNENPSPDEDYDDGDTPPPTDIEQPEEQLPSVELVYDRNGNLLGRMEGDTLLDEDGNPLAWCERSLTGDCVFVDDQGNIVYGGSSSSRQWLDENGNELPMQAMTANGKVVGFAYLYKNKYYSASDRKLLDPQPTGLTPRPMRTVQELNNGAPQVAGYELGGQMYSVQQTLERKPAFDTAMDAEQQELVNVVFATTPNANWTGYKPCLVMPRGWSTNINNGVPLTGAWEAKFNEPSQRLSYGGANGVGGFINASAADCAGVRTVTHDPVSGQWTMTQ